MRPPSGATGWRAATPTDRSRHNGDTMALVLQPDASSSGDQLAMYGEWQVGQGRVENKLGGVAGLGPSFRRQGAILALRAGIVRGRAPGKTRSAARVRPG